MPSRDDRPRGGFSVVWTFAAGLALLLAGAPASGRNAEPAGSTPPAHPSPAGRTGVPGPPPGAAGASNAGSPGESGSTVPPSSNRGLTLSEGRAILIFPFENGSEDRSLYWVREALADGLGRRIRSAGGSIIDREDRLAAMEESGVPLLSTLTLASQIRMAEEFSAGTLITGSFTTHAGALDVRARTVDIPQARTGPWVEIEGSARDIYTLQSALFTRLRPLLPPMGGSPLPEAPPEDGAAQPAYEFLLKSFLEEATDKREALLRRALDVAPEYQRAKIELARLYQAEGQMEKAANLLSRVVTREPELAAQGENLLAEIELARVHPEAAEAALRRSLSSHDTGRAHLLLARLAADRGNRALARAELDRARALDPSDPDLAEVEEALTTLP